MELKKEDLMMKERLSKLAILDTLLAKPGPLSEAEEVVKNKLLAQYSYSQPSHSSEYGTEDLILRDQEELSLKYGDTAQYPPQYPPQPEVEFGFPQVCYCGGAPKIATSYTRLDPGRRYYTYEHVDDGECHVWKWWDVAVMEEIEWLHLKQRWQKINDYTHKLCGAYAAAERQISSGQSDTDVLKVAHDIYFADHKRKFNLEHAWCVLRFEQKWLSLNTPKPTGSSKQNAGEECSQTSSTTVGDQEVRPEGSKAAKARRNNTQGIKSITEYTTVMELKKEDLMMKERLSKLAILDRLLAKPGPLSEAEEVVKNKLLAQYF
ncbi:hypothetical protein F2Q69_00034220 [Brassica cretica]|uniref:No apical meristem-associated C-terminal domain-containing protein n=1 Tax=Brassica cretica TaxID=69181 RepID=A0A8S9SNH9_BRACR|nr:hypothetical protein F2Q69_00034220 [Brassica cretica]